MSRHQIQPARPAAGADRAVGPFTPPAFLTPDDGTVPIGSVPVDIVTAITRAVIAVLTWRADAVRHRPENPASMLSVTQAAALLGMSRTTVIRKADSGELPCVIVSRGTRQKMRRFPRALIEDLAAHGGLGAETDLGDYAARWHAAAISAISATTSTPGRSDRQ